MPSAAVTAGPAFGSQQGAQPAAPPAATSPGAGPVIVVETVKGTFEFETYPNEAPKTVARIVELVNKRFYNGLRVHRVVPNFVMQLGDPTTRDMTRQTDWGRCGSGTPIGVAEITKSAHPREGRRRDGPCRRRQQGRQPVVRDAQPPAALDGQYTVFGKVISGMDVVDQAARSPIESSE